MGRVSPLMVSLAATLMLAAEIDATKERRPCREPAPPPPAPVGSPVGRSSGEFTVSAETARNMMDFVVEAHRRDAAERAQARIAAAEAKRERKAAKRLEAERIRRLDRASKGAK